MRAIEADWIRNRLLALGPERASPVANVGSSTLEFRTRRKPHIHRNLIAPLEEAGFEFLHVDMKAEEGIDLVGDLTDSAFLEKVRASGCRSVICSNLLEHLSDRTGVLDACVSLVRDEGVLILTVPYSYPYHPDPIDTMFRPDPRALAAEVPDLVMSESEILADGTLQREEAAKGFRHAALYLPKAVARILRVWRPREVLAQLHRLTWSWRQFKVTCAVFRRP